MGNAEDLSADYGLGFDDVLVLPGKSDINIDAIDLRTNLTKKIVLNLPLMSSPTSAELEIITESKMAIAISRQGGIGIIHGNMSLENQVTEVDKVKRSQHGVITDPFFLSPNNYIYEANELMGKYKISGVPICENGKLVGIVTNRDLKFEDNYEKKIYEVMTSTNLITANEGTDLEQAKKILAKHKIEKLPIIDNQRRLKGLITTKDIEKSIKYPNASHDANGRLLVGASVFCGDDLFLRCEKLIEANVDVIVLESDLNYGYNSKIINAVKELKNRFQSLQLIAGNVVTPKAVSELAEAGVDAIKIGLGSANNSEINIMTGVGMPQFSAILNCVYAAKQYKIPVISDGGIKYSGDLTKAIVAGADVCMLGNIFLNCYESADRMKLYKKNGYITGKKKSCSEKWCENKKLSEMVKYLSVGLRLGMYYCRAKNISELQACKYIKTNNS